MDKLKKMKSNIPNFFTFLRMAGALCLMLVPELSGTFFVIYTLCGLTDVLDGWIARKTGTASEFGARLDSIADLLFYAVMLFCILPLLLLMLPAEIWYAVGVILFLRLLAYTVAAVKYRRFASIHTYMNKLTGAALFTVPYLLALPIAVPLCWGICVIAMLASVEELLIHICRKTYRTDVKTIFQEE